MQVSTTLPPVGRILLHTDVCHTTGFQKAVAAALASRLGASLLVVDEALLRAVSRATLGLSLCCLHVMAAKTDVIWIWCDEQLAFTFFCSCPTLGCDALEPGTSGTSGFTGLLNTLLSFVLSGGRVACVWDVLTQVLTAADVTSEALVPPPPPVMFSCCICVGMATPHLTLSSCTVCSHTVSECRSFGNLESHTMYRSLAEFWFEDCFHRTLVSSEGAGTKLRLNLSNSSMIRNLRFEQPSQPCGPQMP